MKCPGVVRLLQLRLPIPLALEHASQTVETSVLADVVPDTPGQTKPLTTRNQRIL